MEIITTLNGTEYVLIEHAPNEFTSMPKSVYDAQVEHLTEIPTV